MIYHIALYDYNNSTSVSGHHYTTLPNYIDLTQKKCPTYLNDSANKHHFTTDYIFNYMYPYICTLLTLPMLSSSFESYDTTENGCKFTRYIYKSSDELTMYRVDTNEYTTETYNSICHGIYGYSEYHKLYKYAHLSSAIVNENSSTPRSLLLNTDSMSIPLIPLLVPYFKHIFVADRRSSYSNSAYIATHTFTDMLSYFIKGSVFANKYITNLK